MCDRTRALGRRPPRRKKQRYSIYNISIKSLQNLRKAKDYSRRRKVYRTKNRDTKIYKGKRPKRSRGRRRRSLKGSHFLEVRAPLPAVSRPGPCWGLTDPSLARCYRKHPEQCRGWCFQCGDFADADGSGWSSLRRECCRDLPGVELGIAVQWIA